MTPLVLLPGLNNTALVFADVLPALPPALPVIAPDNPPLDSVEKIAAAHLAALPPRFFMGGFSFGGYVAMAMLEMAPERFAGLALICSTPFGEPPAAGAKRAQAIELARQGKYLTMVNSQAAATFHPDSVANPVIMEKRRVMVEAYGPDNFIAHATAAMNRPDRSALLDGRIPTAAISGSDDTVIPNAVMDSFANRVPGVWRRVVPKTGHLVPMEAPSALAALLVEWMAQAA